MASDATPHSENEPVLPDPDRLDRLVTLLDAAISDGGWHQPHRLVMVEPDPDDPDEAFLLGQLPLPEGDHPLEHLLGFVAPESWVAFGAVCFGWAAPPTGLDAARGTVTARPSQHPERRRVRFVTLVDRSGDEHCTAALDDGTVVDEPGEGIMGDALRRCLRLPTRPPAISTREFVAVAWLTGIVSSRRRLTWQEAKALQPRLEPVPHLSWDAIRRHAARSRAFEDIIEPELAAWMDEGMFARWVLSRWETLGALLRIAQEQLTPNVYQRLERTLSDWGIQATADDAAA